jgi:hypothetical protein
VFLASYPIDIRNYVKRVVMWNPSRLKLLPRFCPITRDKVKLDRRLMAQWMGKVGFELNILADFAIPKITLSKRELVETIGAELDSGTLRIAQVGDWQTGRSCGTNWPERSTLPANPARSRTRQPLASTTTSSAL